MTSGFYAQILVDGRWIDAHGLPFLLEEEAIGFAQILLREGKCVQVVKASLVYVFDGEKELPR